MSGVILPIESSPAVDSQTAGPSRATQWLGSLVRSVVALAAGALTVAGLPTVAAAQPSGIDVSSFQSGVNWNTVASSGVSFVYVKATEGTGYQNPTFAQQYDGAYGAGLVRGAYHLALPDQSSGTDQADYFVDNGGGWSADDHTLPGALDLEADPNGDACYGLAPGEMIAWVHEFANEYLQRTGRSVVIYTSADWWNRCTEGSPEFATSPLWVADYGFSGLTLPTGWDFYTFFQFTGNASVSGVSGNVAQSMFNGDNASLLALANSPR